MTSLSNGHGRKLFDSSFNVCIRIRPMNDREINESMTTCFIPTDDCTGVEELDSENGHTIKYWRYDTVFGPNISNRDIFHNVGSKLCDAALDGFNTVGFLYGQTSSGKTYTLFGDGRETGLVFNTLDYVYSTILKSKDTEYVLRISYIELYNEELKDLLVLSHSPTALKIIEDPAIGPLIQGATEIPFTNSVDMKRLLVEGERHRHFGVTNMNAHSSRSHVLVRLYIESRKMLGSTTSTPLRQAWDGDRPSCICTLNMCDLAGSERANKSGSHRDNLKEGSYINKSLLTLGNVINLLSEGKRGQHVPYRNSKLTRLLSSALGGNAKTFIITCISPASGNILESLSSLRFSSRAKKVVNQVYQHLTMDAKTLQYKLAAQQVELDELRTLHHNQLQSIEKSLKENAVIALKSQRQLRFLLKHAPLAVRELKRLSLYEHAYQIKDDIKAVIAGTLDIHSALEFFDSVVYAYLTKHPKLISCLESFYHELEEMVDSSSSLDNVGRMVNALDSYDDPSLLSVEDVYDGMNFESEELTEEIESYAMLHEEIQQVAGEKMRSMQAELHHMIIVEGDVRSSHNKLANNEDRLLHSIDNLQDHLTRVNKEFSALHHNHEALQHDMRENVKEIAEYRHQLDDKDHEIERLNSKIHSMNMDISSLHQQAVHQGAVFEEEKMKINDEMHLILSSNEVSVKSQLEKILGEMHVMKSNHATLKHDYIILQATNRDLLAEMQSLENQHIKEKHEYDEGRRQLQQEVSQAKQSVETFEIALNLSRHHSKLIQDELDQSKQQSKLKVHELESMLKQLMNETSSLKQENARLLHDTSSYQHASQHQLEEHQCIISEKDRLEGENHRLRLEYDDISTSLVLADQEIADLNTSFTTSKRMLDDDVKSLEKQIQHLNEDSAKLISDLRRKHDSEKHASELRIKSLQQEVDSRKKEVAVKDDIIEGLRDHINTIEQQLASEISRRELMEHDSKESKAASLREIAQYQDKILELQRYISLVEKIIEEEKSRPHDTSIVDEALKHQHISHPSSPTAMDDINYNNYKISSPLSSSTSSSQHSSIHHHNGHIHMDSLSMPVRSPRYSPKESSNSVSFTPRSIYSSNQVVTELKAKVLDLLKQIDIAERNRIAAESDIVAERHHRKQQKEKIIELELIIQQLHDKIASLMRKQLDHEYDGNIKILNDGLTLQLKKAKHDIDHMKREYDHLTKINAESNHKLEVASSDIIRLQAELSAKDRELSLRQQEKQDYSGISSPSIGRRGLGTNRHY